MRSTVLRWVLIVAVLAVLVNHLTAITDPGLYNVRQVTFSGKHEFPQFSYDGRYLYYQATGGIYGDKPCPDIYKLDLKYYNETVPTWKISRVSPGFGRSAHIQQSVSTNPGTMMFDSDFHKIWNTPTKPQIVGTDNYFCPATVCVTPTPTGLPECDAEHIEYFDGTTTYQTDQFGHPILRDVPLSALDANNRFVTTPAINFGFTGYTKQTTTGTGATQVYGTYPYSKGTQLTSALLGYFDGVVYGLTATTPNQKIAFFHGKTIAGGTQTNANAKYVYNTAGTNIYRAVLNDDGTVATAGAVFVASPDANTHQLYPQRYANSEKVIYTRIKNDKSRDIVRWDPNPVAPAPNRVPLTDSTVNSQQPAISHLEKHIAFARTTTTGSDYQLYIADLVDKLPVDSFAAKPFVDASGLSSNYLTDIKQITLGGRIGRVVLNQHNSDIVFEWNPPSAGTRCKQIYHVDTLLNDFSTPRLLSTGIANVDGVDFYETRNPSLVQNVIYASDFIKSTSTTNDKVVNCAVDVCDPSYPGKKPDLTDFCTKNIAFYRHFSSDYELYQADLFGTFKKRITTNNVYDGRPSVSPDQTQVVFTRASKSERRIDIILMNLKDNTETIITDSLGYGYYDAPTFSPDGNYIAFHGYQVDSEDGEALREFIRMMDAYSVVSTRNTNIWVYDLNSAYFYQITDQDSTDPDPFYYSNPTFSSSNRLVFEGTLSSITATVFFHYNFNKYRTTTNNPDDIFSTDNFNPVHASFTKKRSQYITFVGEVSTTTRPTVFTDSIYLAKYNYDPKLPTTTTKSKPTSTVPSTKAPPQPSTSVNTPQAQPTTTTTPKGGAAANTIGLGVLMSVMIFLRIAN
ncbi:hypothetical protein M3Y94_00607300 [Aphelenchoides besseyi]|nr:hypothetical protein M3Y94_00607300 [Aphelenchoides besseyi]KAI6222280.1 Protein TolB [Aphelenchoides besseyi]